MQKQIINFVFNCCCLILLQFNVSAQTRIIAQADDGADPTFYDTDYQMNAIFSTPAVRVANLDEIVRSSSGQLPPGAAPIFLKFELDDIEQLIPIHSFNFEEYVNGYPVFKSEGIEFVVNLSDVCPPHLNTEKYGFSYKFTLVTEDGEDYPIHAPQYSQPSGIFSCRVFTLTCPDCPPKISYPTKNLINLNPGCPKSLAINDSPTATYPGAMECVSRNKPNGNLPINGITSSANKSQWPLASVTPNPFISEFKLTYQLPEESRVNITIFNARGQMMYQSSVLRDNRQHETIVDTQLWANGIYFCRIQTTTDTQLLRVVKSN